MSKPTIPEIADFLFMAGPRGVLVSRPFRDTGPCFPWYSLSLSLPEIYYSKIL